MWLSLSLSFWRWPREARGFGSIGAAGTRSGPRSARLASGPRELPLLPPRRLGAVVDPLCSRPTNRAPCEAGAYVKSWGVVCVTEGVGWRSRPTGRRELRGGRLCACIGFLPAGMFLELVLPSVNAPASAESGATESEEERALCSAEEVVEQSPSGEKSEVGTSLHTEKRGFARLCAEGQRRRRLPGRCAGAPRLAPCLPRLAQGGPEGRHGPEGPHEVRAPRRTQPRPCARRSVSADAGAVRARAAPLASLGAPEPTRRRSVCVCVGGSTRKSHFLCVCVCACVSGG